MARQVGDLWPQASGTASLGAEQLGADGGFDREIRPFAHVHMLSGIWHSPQGQSGVIRFSPFTPHVFEMSVDGGLTFTILGAATPQTYIRVTEATTPTTLGAGTGAGTLTTIGFDTVSINTDSDNYSLASDEITIADAGDYRIEYSISWLGSTTGRRQVRAVLQRDSGGGYANLGKTFHWEDGDGTEIFTSQGFTIVTLTAGDKIRLQGQRNQGAMTTTSIIAHQHIAITKLDTSGGGGGGGSLVSTYIRVSSAATDTTVAAGAAPQTAIIVFDTVDKNTDSGNYSLASNVITVAVAGEYSIDTIVGWKEGASGRRALRAMLQVDQAGGGFVNVFPQYWEDADGAHRASTPNKNIITLEAGAQLRIEAQRLTGSSVSVVDHLFTEFTITSLAGGGGGGGANGVGTFIRLSTTTNTELAAGAPPKLTTLNWNTVDENTDTGNFSLASNAITVADAGSYRIDFIVGWDVQGSGDRTLRVAIQIDSGAGFVNSSTFAWESGDQSLRTSSSGYLVITLGAGDKVRLEGQRNLGTLVTNTDEAFSEFTITKIA